MTQLPDRHGEHGHHGHHHDAQGSEALAELIDLDGEVLHDYLVEVTEWLSRQVSGVPRLIVDLGAGTGIGTIALAQRFAGAEVIAVDASESMLARVRAKASGSGVADRVRGVLADVQAAWPALGAVDLVWASNSLHEMADPDQVFAHIGAALRPDGLLAVAEMDSATRFLPDDIGLGRPGIESRWRSALADREAEPPTPLGPDWRPHLTRAGFTVADERRFVIELQPPHTAPVGRYAHAHLRRIRPMLEQAMAADDLSTLDVLLDPDRPESLLHRGDLEVRTTRTVWLARLA